MNATSAIALVLFLPASAFGQVSEKQEAPSPIQDNSFLVEEAYNQEAGVVQHVNTFSRMWNSKDWVYTLTGEFPGFGNARHQFSYTASDLHSGAQPGTGSGFGDLMLNYRYQLLGDGKSRLAVSPRFSVLVPTGAVSLGRGTGGTGAQLALPVSFALHSRVVTHWNAGATFLRNARNADGDHASTHGYNFGQSVVFLAHPRFNVLVETSTNRYQQVVGPARTEWTSVTYVSPGIRWAHNFASGLQVVPGIAFPIGIGSSAGERGIFLYLSLEAPLRAMYRK